MRRAKRSVEQLSKAELVDLAIKKVQEQEPTFDPKLFSRVRAFQKGKERRVVFSNPVEFIPQRTCAYFSATFYSGEIESVSCEEASNPDKFECDQPRFYLPTPDDVKVMTEILRAMEFPAAKDLLPDETITVYDRGSHYEIIHEAAGGITFFTFDKATRQFHETKHEDLIPDPEESFTELLK